MIPSKEKLEEIIKELQKLMRIQDWDIEIKLVTGLEMAQYENGELDTGGNAYRDLRHNEAVIRINTEIVTDWYYTLVHEMLHIQSTYYRYMVGLLEKGEDELIITAYEALTDTQAKMFCNICPVTNFIKE